jgi:predicted enzyme related to lactoylglutathione lyase
MKEMGAPDGFVDVVAAVNPIGDGDTRAHWSVTFAADDIDATAQRVVELGGTVVVEPHDEPWTKTGTFQDPQGAVFLAAQFVAENSGLTA